MSAITAHGTRHAVSGREAADAYDLFVIGIASALITKDWHLGRPVPAAGRPGADTLTWLPLVLRWRA